MGADKLTDDPRQIAYFTELIAAAERDGVLVYPHEMGTGMRIRVPRVLAQRVGGRILVATPPARRHDGARVARRGRAEYRIHRGAERPRERGGEGALVSDRALPAFLDGEPTLDGFEVVLMADACGSTLAGVTAQARLKAVRDRARPDLKVLVAATGGDIVPFSRLWYGDEAVRVLREKYGTRTAPTRSPSPIGWLDTGTAGKPEGV